MLELKNLAIQSDKKLLFNSVSARIEAGEILTLMGPSGIGKSTLIDAIIGQLDPHFEVAGDVFLGGQSIMNLRTQARRVCVLFQDANLFPHLSVGQNIAFGLTSDHKLERRARIEQALEDAGISGFYDRDPSTLSGGQKTRVALLRTVLAQPLALCLDEPFAKLDPQTRQDIKAFTFDFIKAHQIPSLLVTHDQNDAPDQVLHLSERVE